MNREIKFRAHYNGVIYHHVELTSYPDGSISIMMMGEHSRQFSPDAGKIDLMQFTGLADKNGKEIWEGDIVNFDFRKGIVIYSKTQADFTIEDATDNMVNFHLADYTDYDNIEVIGNIYTNPELLT